MAGAARPMGSWGAPSLARILNESFQILSPFFLVLCYSLPSLQGTVARIPTQLVFPTKPMRSCGSSYAQAGKAILRHLVG